MSPRNILKRGSLLTVLAIDSTIEASQDPLCRCFPGDACWPSTSTWDAFNQSVDGRLVKTVPLATPCHIPNYDEKECEILKDGWLLPDEQ